MPIFTIENFGCRATEADASALRQQLLSSGLALADDHAVADWVVLNTCTVTAAADSQAREAVRRIHRTNPAARIIVTGCYAQRAPEEIATLEGVAWVVGNTHQSAIRKLVQGQRDFVPLESLNPDALSLARGPAKILTGDIFAEVADMRMSGAERTLADRTRPILKIQDGCNNRCSYCVIPFVRGRSRSLSPNLVVDEVRALVEAGTREIVLSGINLGSYGRDLSPRSTLASVVRQILTDTGLERLRFSSIEPQDVTEDFVSLVAESSRIAPHFHIPLQSGSDRILRAMHRWYRTAHYAERAETIRRLIPDAAIGADVITGFPGETQEDFDATYEFIDRLPFTYLHVFSFSPRPGTKAEHLGSPVQPALIRERARSLRARAQKKSEAFRASQSGVTQRALTLARQGDNWTEGLTGNYLKVRIAGRIPANEWHNVRIGMDLQTPKGNSGDFELSEIPAQSRNLAFENHLGEREVAAVGNR
jgi:threonylcarbamoyladenosine tRNA methylthiotransferase MtaB